MGTRFGSGYGESKLFSALSTSRTTIITAIRISVFLIVPEEPTVAIARIVTYSCTSEIDLVAADLSGRYSSGITGSAHRRIEISLVGVGG